MTNHSFVPRSLWEITNERRASSLTRPPAFRITWASPSARPAYFAGSSRASIQVRRAKCLAGGIASCPLLPKFFAYASFAASTSLTISLMDVPLVPQNHWRLALPLAAQEPRHAEQVMIHDGERGEELPQRRVDRAEPVAQRSDLTGDGFEPAGQLGHVPPRRDERAGDGDQVAGQHHHHDGDHDERQREQHAFFSSWRVQPTSGRRASSRGPRCDG